MKGKSIFCSEKCRTGGKLLNHFLKQHTCRGSKSKAVESYGGGMAEGDKEKLGPAPIKKCHRGRISKQEACDINLFNSRESTTKRNYPSVVKPTYLLAIE